MCRLIASEPPSQPCICTSLAAKGCMNVPMRSRSRSCPSSVCPSRSRCTCSSLWICASPSTVRGVSQLFGSSLAGIILCRTRDTRQRHEKHSSRQLFVRERLASPHHQTKSGKLGDRLRLLTCAGTTSAQDGHTDNSTAELTADVSSEQCGEQWKSEALTSAISSSCRS